jgi:hypothetical protein
MTDLNNFRYVGWEQTPEIEELFSDRNIRLLSRKISELLEGVDPLGRTIVIPDKNITNTLSTVIETYAPSTGSINSRYVIPFFRMGYEQNVMAQTIQLIVQDAEYYYAQQEANSKLTIWTSVLGTFNTHGLMPHSKIYTRQKRPAPMQFHMRY